MRIPLIRLTGDTRSIAWWEWLFAPIVAALFIAWLLVTIVFVAPVFFVAAILYVPFSVFDRRLMCRREKALAQRLASMGRYLPFTELEAKLHAGQGTLIVEHVSTKGPIREWWTPDDVPRTAPEPLSHSFHSPGDAESAGQRAYARKCAQHYVAVDGGTAKLTEIPWEQRRKLRATHPQAQVVTLVMWLAEPFLAEGDLFFES
jgi:hypothetical protein